MTSYRDKVSSVGIEPCQERDWILSIVVDVEAMKDSFMAIAGRSKYLAVVRGRGGRRRKGEVLDDSRENLG